MRGREEERQREKERERERKREKERGRERKREKERALGANEPRTRRGPYRWSYRWPYPVFTDLLDLAEAFSPAREARKARKAREARQGRLSRRLASLSRNVHLTAAGACCSGVNHRHSVPRGSPIALRDRTGQAEATTASPSLVEAGNAD